MVMIDAILYARDTNLEELEIKTKEIRSQHSRVISFISILFFIIITS